MTPGTYNFPDCVRGDTINAKRFTITTTVDEVTAPLDLTDITIKATFRGKKTLILTEGDGITIVNAIGGVFEIDPFSLNEYGKWTYDIQFTTSTGIVKTYLRGEVQVLNDLTI